MRFTCEKGESNEKLEEKMGDEDEEKSTTFIRSRSEQCKLLRKGKHGQVLERKEEAVRNSRSISRKEMKKRK